CPRRFGLPFHLTQTQKLNQRLPHLPKTRHDHWYSKLLPGSIFPLPRRVVFRPMPLGVPTMRPRSQQARQQPERPTNEELFSHSADREAAVLEFGNLQAW